MSHQDLPALLSSKFSFESSVRLVGGRGVSDIVSLDLATSQASTQNTFQGVHRLFSRREEGYMFPEQFFFQVEEELLSFQLCLIIIFSHFQIPTSMLPKFGQNCTVLCFVLIAQGLIKVETNKYL